MGYKEIFANARSEGRTMLSEIESRAVLREFGIPVSYEMYFSEIEQLKENIDRIEYPVVLKGISRHIAHKSENNLVRLYIKNEVELISEFQSLMGSGGVEGVLISPQITDRREFLLGLKCDPLFGYVVVFGLGGIFTEVLKDISMRICPLNKRDAEEMISEIRSGRLLGRIRGLAEVERDSLTRCILNLADLPEKTDEVAEIDINPIMFDKGKPLAVDALIILKS